MWRVDDSGVFSVKFMFEILEELMVIEDVVNPLEKKVFSYIWKCSAPSKVVAFSWKLLRDRIPTKRNLRIRNLMAPEASTNCVLCEESEENSRNLFLHCHVTSLVWSKL